MPIISPKIPSGLEDLMRGLAKSCIKENPDNIYEFAAEYFENLLRQRDGGMDQGYKNLATYKVYKKNRSGRSRRDKENVIDGSTFRGGVTNVLGQELIKSGSRGSAKEKYFASADKSDIEEIFLPSSRPSTAEIEDKSISMESDNNTTIAKVPSIKDEEEVLVQSINSDDEDIKNMVLDEDMEQAALKIQSRFRGFKTRKDMKRDMGDEMEIDGGNVVNDEEDVIVKKEEITLSAGLPSVEFKDDVEQLSSDVENVIEGSQSMLKTVMQDENILDTITSSQECVDSHVIPLMTEDNENDSITKDIDDDETAEIAENQSEVTDIECSDGNVMIMNDEELTAASEQKQTKTQHELVEGAEIIETCLEHKVFQNLKHSVEMAQENVNEKPKENYVNSPEECVEIIHHNADDKESERIELEVTDKLEASTIPTEETQQETIIIKEDAEAEEELSTMSFDNKESVAEIENQEDVDDTEIVNDIPDVTELILQSKSTEDHGAVEEVTLDEDNAERNVGRAVDMMENVSEETVEKLSVEEEEEEKEEEKVKSPLEPIEVPEENVLSDDKLSSKFLEGIAESIKKFENIFGATGEVENETENIVSEDVMYVNNNTMPEGTENTDENTPTVDLIAIENIETLPENVIQSMDKIESTQITTDASVHESGKLTNTESAEMVLQTQSINEASEVVAVEIQNSCEDLLEIEAVDEAAIKASPIESANVELTQDEKSEDQTETLENVESTMIPNETMEKESLLLTEGSNAAMDKSQESSGEGQEVYEIIERKSVDKLETFGAIQPVDEVDFTELLKKLKQISAEDEEVYIMNADEILAIVNDNDNASVDNVEAVLEKSHNVVLETLSVDASDEKETELSIDVPPTEKSIDDSFVNSGEDIGAVAPSDDILEPEKEESEIPEESSTTIDENLTTDDVPFITNEENQSSIDVTDEIIPESQQENDVPKANEEEDVNDMILDDEMEGAALKIQAAFRGHQIRKETAPPKNTNDNENDNKNEDNQSEEKTDNEIVIDNCSDEKLFSTEENDTVNEETTVEVEENEETTTQETKEEEEEEAQNEEETNDEEEKEVEEEAEEEGEVEEVEVETVENEGGSDEPDTAAEPADQASGSTEQATNDDDDVANMVMDENMEQAALKIQSTFRGHKTRQDMKNKGEEEEVVAEAADASEEKKDTVEELNEDVANMVLDEEMEQAALKIQSTFRGHKTRKDMKNKDGEDETEEKEEDEVPKEEEEKPEEAKAEEVKTEEPTSSGKTAQQLQDEEDIANIVMDKDMEKAALRIQNTFRGKRFGAKKSTQDEDISYETSNSSSEDKHEEDNNLEASNESPIKILSEEKPFTNEDTIKLSQEHTDESVDKSVTEEEDDSNFMAAQQYSGSNDERYTIDRFGEMLTIHHNEKQESFEIGQNIEMILLKSSEELIGESASFDITSGEAGDDEENYDEKKNRKMKTFSIEDVIGKDSKDDEDEVEEPLAVEKIVQPLTITSLEDEKLIENFDFKNNKNTAEAMYMQLKKNEMDTQKQVDAIEQEEQKEEQEEEEEEDDDDVIVMVPTVMPERKLRYGFSMDDRLLGLSKSILSEDYSPKLQSVESVDERGYNPMLEASKQSSSFMDQLHNRSESNESNEVINYSKLTEDMGDEDDFDAEYQGNIRQKMMASSMSIADSDYFDPTKSQDTNEDTIRTALETINSTDSESTIASAATKIQAGARGLITRRKLNNNTSSSQQCTSNASFGNAAIDKSLDDFIVAQEQERLEGGLKTDNDKKSDNVGVVEIKLDQKHLLPVDERRRKLQREDAIQRNSTCSDTSSNEKLMNDINNSTMVTVVDIQSQQPLVKAEESISIQEVLEPKEATTKTKSVVSMKTSRIPKSMIPRQRTMPVQIDTNLIRILPKHLRKRIRSAESDKKKKSK